jgi:GrpB-like predicted nucleotidyltransferase (UPF0157 family)/quercetin dioxygenase-like cupin family protein
VRIFRFDEDVSIPVTRFGSRFRIGPLIGDDARVRVQIMHLSPGGVIGRHPAVAPQLFAVVAGRGRVSGRDAALTEVGPGLAALWEPGEEHDAASDEGMTAVCIEGAFDVWAVGVTGDIVVSDYDSAWPDWFAAVHAHVWPAVAEVALRIDHVGSTAVPGLAAKPIIDMDIVVASEHDVPRAIERLATVGYRWRGDMGIPGREVVKLTGDADLPPHHLYVVVEDNRAHLDHWLLRDLLRSDQDARERYGVLKRRNVGLAGGNIDVYMAAKAALVAELLTRPAPSEACRR